MKHTRTTLKASLLASILGLALSGLSLAEQKPVKVYILSGQSNMVGTGRLDGIVNPWYNTFFNAELSVYPGTPDATADYDKLKATEVVKLERFGRVVSKAYPEKGVKVVRGQVRMPKSGLYEFRPGSAHSVMTINGEEVYRRLSMDEELVSKPIQLEADKSMPFKITYLSADAKGTGKTIRLGAPGALSTLVKAEGKFPYLVDKKGNFKPRDDVYYKGVVTATADKWLDVGCAGGGRIGPELGFGHMLGNHHEEPVLILKASQGNRSLSWDFLPPGSESFEHIDKDGKTWVYAGYQQSPSRWEKGTKPEPTSWYAGKQYDECFTAAKEVLANFDESFPHWKGRGYEVAGFVWWQGHKDGGEQGKGSAGLAATRYEQNLVSLIGAMRNEFNAPNAPFVVATCGFNGGKGWEPGSGADTIFKAQMNVGDPAKHPAFKGTVRSVDTRAFYREPEVSPRSQSFHYHQNAETYMLVGEATGKAMIELVK